VTVYALAADVRVRAGLEPNVPVDEALIAASRSIDTYCGRRFYPDSAVSDRDYSPLSLHELAVDDIASTTGLVVKTDDNLDGTFETTWTSTEYGLTPTNQIVGNIAWPITGLRAYTRFWPRPVEGHRYDTRRPTVRITALWGWVAPPAAVRSVCLDVAARAATGVRGVRSETLGGYAVTYAGGGGESAVWLAPDELRILDFYRRR
jgi:hypothetical protein